MSILPNNTKDCFKAIKTALKEKIAGVYLGKSWERMRYADNLNQWLELAAVELPGSNEKRLRVIFIYLADFSSERAEARTTKVTATYAFEIIEQFRPEGTDEDNSTLDFESVLGDLVDLFLPEESLGFTDAASQEIWNGSLKGDGSGEQGGGKPVYVDGILAHRKTCSLDVTFRVCR